MEKIINKKRYFHHKQSDVPQMLFKRNKGEKVLFVVTFVIFLFYAISLLYPFWQMINDSLKGILEYQNCIGEGGHAFDLPKAWKFKNYYLAFKDMKTTNSIGRIVFFPEMFLNSIWFTIIAVGEGVFFSSCTGYCLAKYSFKGRNFIYALAILAMTFPIIGTTGASFKLAGDLGIYNSPIYVVLTSCGGFGFNFLIMYAFFKNVSWTYAEAVFIDGGGHFTVFFKVMLPQAIPTLITLCIMAFISAWNDYMTPLLYLPDFQTLASGIHIIGTHLERIGNTPAYYAALIISIMPIIIIFVLFSDTIMSNFTVGGIKG